MESGVYKRMDCIEKKVDDIPDKVKQSILENYQLNGVVPITQTQLTDMFNAFQHSVLQTIQSNYASIHQDRQVTAVPVAFQSWTWGGRIHPVPMDFRFPKCNLKLM